MHISFPYPEIKPLEAPDRNLLGIFSPSIVKMKETKEEIIERAKGIMVSQGISKTDTEKLGLIYSRDPQEASDIAFSLKGRDAKVAVLQRGGEILPVIQK
jgi:hypothetical protein